MDVAALGPAIDLAAAGEHAVVAEVERRILDDDALVPIILDRVREIDQDMARPLPEMIAVQPAAFGDGEFGEHARLELDAVIAGLGMFVRITLAETLTGLFDRAGLDRKSVVVGKRGAVRVDLGGGRIIKKKQ